MSLTPSTLMSIQQAGQGLHSAHQAVAKCVQTTAQQMVAMVASQPFSPECEQAFAQLRAVSRMAQELAAMEEQLKTIYITAADLVEEDAPLLTALPGRVARPMAHDEGANDMAEDVEVKVASVSPRRSNDEKVMDFLTSVLDRRSWKALPHSVLAEGAGIPLGSVGLALRRAVAAGKLREGAKGFYRLG